MKRAMHVPYTEREWRIRKRSHLRALRRALEDFRMGCVYVPGGEQAVRDINTILIEIEQKTSAKAWGH